MAKRLSVIQSHITSRFPPLAHDNSLDEYRERSSKLDKELFRSLYFGKYNARGSKIRGHILSNPIFSHNQGTVSTKNEERRLALERLSTSYFFSDSSFEKDQADPADKTIMPYIYSELEQGLVTVTIVHTILFLDSLQELGTEKHRPIIDKAYSLEELGCFAMTELGHGSDVSKLETEAVYDHSTREFILHTPTATAAKWWIGGLAKNAVKAIVFARLIVNEQDEGVHAFVVPVRGLNYEEIPGVTIGDCGQKIELNCIDNGFLIFNQYRVSYDCLLDKHSRISAKGKYLSEIKKKEKRLGILLAGLVRGRISVIFGSESNLRTALTIAVRFSAIRKQFQQDGPETRLLDYTHHRYRLMPIVSRMMAIKTLGEKLLDSYEEIRLVIRRDPEGTEAGEYHAMLSAGKAVSSWFAIKDLQTIRESLGGHGYSSHSSIGRLRSAHDIHTTWEGDNTVLIQQTAKFILKQVQRTFKGQAIVSPSLTFLKMDFEMVKKSRPVFTTAEELKNEKVLIELLEYRMSYHLHNSIAQLQENAGKSGGMMKAWNDTLSFYLLDLSKAYGELVMAKALIRKIPSGGDFTLTVFKNIFMLFALSIIESDLPPFMDHAYLDGKHVKIIRSCVIDVCNEIAEVSVGIFDAIGTSDVLHGSALGVEDGQIYAEIIKRAESDPTCYQKAEWIDSLLKLRETGNKVRTKNNTNNKAS